MSKVLIQRAVVDHLLNTTKWQDWKVVEDDPTQIRYALREFKIQFDPFRKPKSKNKRSFRLNYVKDDYVVTTSTFKPWMNNPQKSGEELLKDRAAKMAGVPRKQFDLPPTVELNLDW